MRGRGGPVSGSHICLNDLSSLDSPCVVVHDGRKPGTMRVWEQPDGLFVFMLLVGGFWVISFSVRASERGVLFGNPIQGRPNGDLVFFPSSFFFAWRDQGSVIRSRVSGLYMYVVLSSTGSVHPLLPSSLRFLHPPSTSPRGLSSIEAARRCYYCPFPIALRGRLFRSLIPPFLYSVLP